MEDAIVVVDLVSSSLFYKPVIKEMGFKLIAVYTKPVSVFAGVFHLPEETLTTGCDEVIIGDDKAKVVEKLKKSKFKVKAVIPGADSGVCLADELTDALHLFGNPIRHSKARREKGEMRKLLKKKGFSCPDFRLCKTEKELLEFVKEHSFPLVIKTPQGACTHHVYICDDEKKLVRNFHAILNEKDVYGGHADYAIVEEFISGKEYIVNTFSNGERVYVTDIWAYDKIDSETFHNIYYNCFSLPLSDPTVKPLIDLGVKLVQAFEVKRGPAHLEIMDDPRRGPTLIEINARFAGARIPLFMKKHSNFDPYKKTVEVLVHGKTEVPDPIIMKKYCAWVCCPIFESGKIEKIKGIGEIEKLSSYDGHQLNIQPGDLITATTDFSSMPLVVFLAHEKREGLLKDVEKTHALFGVTFSEKATGT